MIGIDRLLEIQAARNTATHVSSPRGWVASVDADRVQELIAAEETLARLRAHDPSSTDTNDGAQPTANPDEAARSDGRNPP